MFIVTYCDLEPKADRHIQVQATDAVPPPCMKENFKGSYEGCKPEAEYCGNCIHFTVTEAEVKPLIRR